MIDKKKIQLAYLSYPFTSDPVGNTEKACDIARKIMLKFPNIFVIVPHTSVDMTMFGKIKKKHNLIDNVIAPQLEFTILNKIDIFIKGVNDNCLSSGCVWELSYCMLLNRTRSKQIQIMGVKDF